MSPIIGLSDRGLAFPEIGKPLTNRIIPLLAWTLPLIGLIVSSLLANNNFLHYRTLSPILFPFALWLGREIGIRRWNAYVFAAAWIPLLVASLFYWNPSIRGGGLDQVASEIRSQWRPGDRLVYTTITVGLPFNYYLGDLPHSWDDTVQAPFLSVHSITHSDLPRTAKNSGRTWLIATDDNMITPDEQLVLDGLERWQLPLYTIKYIQASAIQVYLVKDQEISK
jgi:hypothetical protein